MLLVHVKERMMFTFYQTFVEPYGSKVPPDFPGIPPKPPGPAPTACFAYPTPNSTQMKIRITAEIAGENAFEPR